MYVSPIPVLCYYINSHIVRTDNDVKYDGNKASIVPLEIPVDCTFEQLGDIIFSSTPIDKRKFNLVLKCKYPLKCGNRFQPFTIWNDRSVHQMLNMVNTTVIEKIELFVEVVRRHRQANQSIGVAEIENLAEIDYGCGPSSGPVLHTGGYGDHDACAYEEGNDESDEDVNDEYDDDLHVQADGHVSSFHTTNQVLENERGIFVSAHALSCDVSNIADDDDGPDESAPIRWDAPYAYHRICMRHLASNFMTRFKDKLLKNLVCREAVATTPRKMNRHMATIRRINPEALQWLEAIPLRYGHFHMMEVEGMG